MDNPRNEPLEDKTHFTVRLFIDVDVEVPARSTGLMHSGQRDAVRRAEHFVEKFLSQHRDLLEFHGIKFHQRRPDEEECLEVRGMPFDPKWLEPVERLFDRIYFDGNGDISARDGGILVARLMDAFSALSGLQQGAEDPEAEQRIANVARDLFVALTGKESLGSMDGN